MNTVLVVEDDVELRKGLVEALREEGYRVCSASTGAEAQRKFIDDLPDLVLLDLGLPDMDGMFLLKEFLTQHPEVPLLILTARGAVEDRVGGLDGGAVDYMVKPFALPELLARMRNHLRRGGAGEPTVLEGSGMRLDRLARTVLYRETELIFPPREFDLLTTLMRVFGHPVSREQIAREVWNSPRRMSSLDNLIDVHISRLRDRLKADAPGVRLRTVRGVGYSLEET